MSPLPNSMQASLTLTSAHMFYLIFWKIKLFCWFGQCVQSDEKQDNGSVQWCFWGEQVHWFFKILNFKASAKTEVKHKQHINRNTIINKDQESSSVAPFNVNITDTVYSVITKLPYTEFTIILRIVAYTVH